jgi:hypothetical protein
VHFFGDVHVQYPNTRQVLAQRTKEYRGWVSGYARNHKIPILKAQKGVSKEDSVRPDLQRMERRNQHGVYTGLRARMALLVLPGQVLKPLLAASMGTRPTQGVQNPTTLDNYYETIRVGRQGVFRELGLAA